MQTAAKLNITIATVTDRGLSEKRPVNEDSLLADAERGIFAVADGVGGAQSGEVASQTAIETLSEAFRRHTPEDDIEDLLELAIQRANAAIYGMTRKGGSRVSMMATTIVALHIGTDSVTFGHVGDSRIYRLAPEGVLSRETIDHSVVEEELRAGRITEEQAAAHPNRNIISRALGAEAAVEVDLHAHPLVEGTTYLLCSDGITRHIHDEELQSFLRDYDDLEAVCEELKRLCYQRGAEDNLTAVIIRIGARTKQSFTSSPVAHAPVYEDETTLSPRIRHNDSPPPITSPIVIDASNNGGDNGGRNRTVVTIPQTAEASAAGVKNSQPERKQSNIAGTLTKLTLAVLILSVVGFGGFYAWTLFQEKPVTPLTTLPEVRGESNEFFAAASYEERKAAIDARPDEMWLRMMSEKQKNPNRANDPEFVYLYGRASVFKGETEEAANAFSQVITHFKNQPVTTNGAQTAAAGRALQSAENALQSGEPQRIQNAAKLLDEYITLSHAGITNQPNNQPNNQPDNQFNNQPDNPNASQTPPPQ